MSVLLSRACENAIRAMLCLAKQKNRKYVPVKEIARHTDISYHFLGKILQTLTQQGLLLSHKGPKGGLTLAKSPEQIRIIDIIEIMDGMTVFEKCVLGLPECSDARSCDVHKEWGEIREQIKTMFSRKTLAELSDE